ncbi:hypothetical protein [Insolitispirillum peregrinum]|nr:hypothetical protein [Insolitispirillum peregrinum]
MTARGRPRHALRIPEQVQPPAAMYVLKEQEARMLAATARQRPTPTA